MTQTQYDYDQLTRRTDADVAEIWRAIIIGDMVRQDQTPLQWVLAAGYEPVPDDWRMAIDSEMERRGLDKTVHPRCIICDSEQLRFVHESDEPLAEAKVICHRSHVTYSYC